MRRSDPKRLFALQFGSQISLTLINISNITTSRTYNILVLKRELRTNSILLDTLSRYARFPECILYKAMLKKGWAGIEEN